MSDYSEEEGLEEEEVISLPKYKMRYNELS